MQVDKIKWNLAGFKALRKERGVMSDLIDRGQAIAAAAGDGVEAEPFTGRNRARVSVLTATVEAARKNARDNTLIRALDAGR
jgi:hypothetical protein